VTYALYIIAPKFERSRRPAALFQAARVPSSDRFLRRALAVCVSLLSRTCAAIR
jgi:hypothetical protein